MTDVNSSREKMLCSCGSEAVWTCFLHKTFFCRKCCYCPESEGKAHKDYRQPIGHMSGSRREVIPNLWLGDRFDAEEIGNDVNWAIFCVGDYFENEFPKEPSSARRYVVFENREHLVDCGFELGFGTDWTESPELRVNITTMNIIACEIQDTLKSGKKVLVHCVGDIHRSPLVVAWFLYVMGYFDWIDEAYDRIIRIRPEVQRRQYWLPDHVRQIQFRGKTE